MPRFRWAVQADYFARRIASNDLTGISGPRDNRAGRRPAFPGRLIRSKIRAGKPIRAGKIVVAVNIAITLDGRTVYAAAAGKVVPISTATNKPGTPRPAALPVM